MTFDTGHNIVEIQRGYEPVAVSIVAFESLHGMFFMKILKQKKKTKKKQNTYSVERKRMGWDYGTEETEDVRAKIVQIPPKKWHVYVHDQSKSCRNRT